MSDWEKLPIGELFSIEKGSLQSTKCMSGDYTFITASSEWKTHNEYSHDCEALIYAVAASGSLGRCHYYNGKFIASDLCFILRAKDEKKRPINYRFYQNVFKFLKDEIVEKTKSGTSKESITQKRFAAHKIPYMDIKYQTYWEKKLSNLNETIEKLEFESSIQSTYLTKLRQAILQEAIEGKLTADWRKENPLRKGDPDYDAQALLEKIKAEKEKLIKEGNPSTGLRARIKKQNPLAPIKPEEVPFELPEGWIWTRLGEFLKNPPRNGYSPKEVNYGTKVKSLKLGATTWGKFNPLEYKFIDEDIPADSVFWLKPNDILIQRSNSIDYVGVTAIYTGKENEFIYPDLMMKLEIVNPISVLYSHEVLSAPYCREYFRKNAKGAQKSMPKINQGVVNNTLIPLPPLAEQHAIVERVEKLLAIVDELEKQVAGRKELAEQLMQAVLREAFKGGK